MQADVERRRQDDHHDGKDVRVHLWGKPRQRKRENGGKRPRATLCGAVPSEQGAPTLPTAESPKLRHHHVEAKLDELRACPCDEAAEHSVRARADVLPDPQPSSKERRHAGEDCEERQRYDGCLYVAPALAASFTIGRQDGHNCVCQGADSVWNLGGHCQDDVGHAHREQAHPDALRLQSRIPDDREEHRSHRHGVRGRHKGREQGREQLLREVGRHRRLVGGGRRRPHAVPPRYRRCGQCVQAHGEQLCHARGHLKLHAGVRARKGELRQGRHLVQGADAR
mmetsp:Transcript_17514/g.50012  ORF Transcript_17514/g.50012 Transcript_17514/m.50012 type:complete len:282 (-) Transcript_17514:234-1079(-)